VEGGGWRVEGGGWTVDGGGWTVEGRGESGVGSLMFASVFSKMMSHSPETLGGFAEFRWEMDPELSEMGGSTR
jgi:hypothetical protein